MYNEFLDRIYAVISEGDCCDKKDVKKGCPKHRKNSRTCNDKKVVKEAEDIETNYDELDTFTVSELRNKINGTDMASRNGSAAAVITFDDRESVRYAEGDYLTLKQGDVRGRPALILGGTTNPLKKVTWNDFDRILDSLDDNTIVVCDNSFAGEGDADYVAITNVGIGGRSAFTHLNIEVVAHFPDEDEW